MLACKDYNKLCTVDMSLYEYQWCSSTAELQYNYMPVPVSKYMNSVHMGSLD